MKKYKSKSIDLTLPLENAEGEERVFVSKEKATAAFTDTIQKLASKLTEVEAAKKNQSDKMSATELYLKQLDFIYKDLDTDWIQNNFSLSEIKEITEDVLKTLTGLKKASKS